MMFVWDFGCILLGNGFSTMVACRSGFQGLICLLILLGLDLIGALSSEIMLIMHNCLNKHGFDFNYRIEPVGDFKKIIFRRFRRNFRRLPFGYHSRPIFQKVLEIDF